MNPELQKELALWLSSIRETGQLATGFVLEQAPLVVREKVIYGRVWSSLLLVVAVVCVVVAVRFSRRGWARYLNGVGNKAGHDVWLEVPGAGQAVIGGVVAFFLCAAALESARIATMAWFAPRLYILEWISDLLKS